MALTKLFGCLLVGAITTALVYAMVGFIYLEWDVNHWDEFQRFLFLVLSFSVSAFTVGMYLDLHKRIYL